ncbi:MAG: hypothetical protein RLZZ458_3339 [Planctomycetota bacterium]
MGSLFSIRRGRFFVRGRRGGMCRREAWYGVLFFLRGMRSVEIEGRVLEPLNLVPPGVYGGSVLKGVNRPLKV